jgi:predicted dehydrogenase
MLRVGFVGVGGRAQVHLRALDQLGKTKVVAVVDTVPATAERVAAAHGARACPSVAELLASETLDAVYAAVPYHANAAVALPVLGARVPLFVEKVLALTPTDARAIAAAAERAGVPTSVGYQWRYFDTVDRLRGALPPERIGLIVGRYYSDKPRTQWGLQRRYFGGQVYAQLTHLLDLARYAGGEIERVQAAYGQRIWPPAEREPAFDVWDVSAVQCRFGTGAVGSFSCTYGLGGRFGPGNVTELGLVARGEMWTLDRTALRRRDTTGAEDVWEAQADPVVRMHEAFIEAVSSGRTEAIRSPIGDALHSALVCAAADASAAAPGGIAPESL